jgi:uncharacterized protein (DUF362 family)
MYMMVQTQASAAPRFDFPESIRSAQHILIKPNVGYAAAPPVIVRMTLLDALVQQLLALRTDSRISIVEGVCTKVSAQDVFRRTGLTALAGPRVEVLDADTLMQMDVINPAPRSRFKSFSVPDLLDKANARISIAPFKRTVLNGKPLISATIKNLFGLLPRSVYHARSPHARGRLHVPTVHDVIADLYRSIGNRFDFGVVDLHEKYVNDDWQPDRGRSVPVGLVLSGIHLPVLDRAACLAAGEPVCDYLDVLQD